MPLEARFLLLLVQERALAPLAKKAKIPFVVVEDRSQEKAEEKLLKICKKYQVGSYRSGKIYANFDAKLCLEIPK